MTATVTKRSVRSDGLVGVLASPDTTGCAPGVLLLGGSEGGLHERDAEVLAAQGFTVLALAYFGMAGLPPGLIDIPIEYFSRALDVLGAQPRSGDRFGVIGGSRGGEAALLVGAHDARIGAAVSVVGSGVMTPGIDFSRGGLLDILSNAPGSWTVDGAPLPYLQHVIPDEMRELVEQRRPVRLAWAFPPPPTEPEALTRVSIPVERIDGPVLLISAADDGGWPSEAYSEVAANRLRVARHRYAFEHRVLEAGHLIAGPPGAAMTTTTSPGPGVTFEMGGAARTNTAARAEAWRSSVDFLVAALH